MIYQPLIAIRHTPSLLINMPNVISTLIAKKTYLILINVLTLLVSVDAFAQSSPKITICESCTTNLEYSQAALEATNLLPGNAQDIYVVNTTQQQIQVYQALLSINNSGSGEDSLGLEMRLLSGDASLLSAINQALDLTLGLSLELARTINADELILPDELDSALDLIGPEDSSAGGYRNALRNSLNERYNRYLLQQNLNTVQNWGEGAFSKFLTDSDLLKNKVILVEFPDGTRVNVDVTKIAEVLGSFEKLGSFIEAKIALDLEINLRSIASDEQMSFPQSAGQFSNFNASNLNPDLTRALEELALRFGRADELRP